MTNTETMDVPAIDIAGFLADPDSAESREACKRVAEIFAETGILIVRDPRVREEHNNTFLDMMEDYFAQPDEDKQPDIHPEYAYQVGATPENVEVPRCATDPSCQPLIDSLAADHKPTLPLAADLKWRFFWRIGERPKETKFQELNVPPVIPKKFPQWEEVMNTWGNLMLAAVQTVAEMAATGFGLERDAFTKRTHQGPHLLAPTGSDLSKHNKKGSIFAGFHYDLNFLTIHGKSRYPGLYVWRRDGTKLTVRVPDGCLLVQAGKQLEWLTGDHVHAGYHEVIVNDETLKAVERQRAAGRPLWRVSSTLFYHIASDQVLEPLGHFATPETLAKYPPTLAGDYVNAELEVINLKRDE